MQLAIGARKGGCCREGSTETEPLKQKAVQKTQVGDDALYLYSGVTFTAYQEAHQWGLQQIVSRKMSPAVAHKAVIERFGATISKDCLPIAATCYGVQDSRDLCGHPYSYHVTVFELRSRSTTFGFKCEILLQDSTICTYSLHTLLREFSSATLGSLYPGTLVLPYCSTAQGFQVWFDRKLVNFDHQNYRR